MINIQKLSGKIRSNPLIIHINPIGLLRMGTDNDSRFLKFNLMLNKINDNGGNIAIPVYSYSYTKNKIFDMLNTPSDLDELSEFLRMNNKSKRTADANFSYLLFGDKFSKKHYEVSNYSSFGEGSLIEEVFNKDGYLGAIGGALEYFTEIHFFERKLNMNYRFDKDFYGTTIDKESFKFNNRITYYCRDLNLNYVNSFKQLRKDLVEENLIEVWNIPSFNLKIEVIKMKVLFDFVKSKLELDSKYLCSYGE
jgi:aminoglycoside 3-N-acetyltransferase